MEKCLIAPTENRSSYVAEIIPAFMGLYVFLDVIWERSPERLKFLIISFLAAIIIGYLKRRIKPGKYIYGLSLLLISALISGIFIIIYFRNPGFITTFSILCLLVSSTTFLTRKWINLSSLAFAVIVLIFLSIGREKVVFSRLFFAWAMSILWLALLMINRRKLQPGFIASFLVLATLIIVPIKNYRYLALSTSESEMLRNQENVEPVFDNDSPFPFPDFRMEFLCNEQTGDRIVTPHYDSTRAAVISPDGQVTTLDLGGEAPDKSVMTDGIWRLLVNGYYLEMEMNNFTTLRQIEICDTNAYFMNYNKEYNLVTITRDGSPEGTNYLLDLNEPVMIKQIPGRRRETIPIDGTTVISGEEDGISLLNVETGEVLKRIEIERHGKYYEIDFDRRVNRIYTMDELSGIIHIVDYDSFKETGTISADMGVRGVLFHPSDPGILYSYNYATGRIIEHVVQNDLRARTWEVGPVLRNIAFDCDMDSILAVSSQGGFHILLSADSLPFPKLTGLEQAKRL